MRPLYIVVGSVVFLLGIGWALQGAYILPATFMRGPEWVGIGGAVAIFGVALAILGFRPKKTAESKTS